MPNYLLSSSDYDENTEIWLEHPDDFSDEEFEGIVNQASKELFLSDEDACRFPWWGYFIRDVADGLCANHGFSRVEARASVERVSSAEYIPGVVPDRGAS